MFRLYDVIFENDKRKAEEREKEDEKEENMKNAELTANLNTKEKYKDLDLDEEEKEDIMKDLDKDEKTIEKENINKLLNSFLYYAKNEDKYKGMEQIISNIENFELPPYDEKNFKEDQDDTIEVFKYNDSFLKGIEYFKKTIFYENFLRENKFGIEQIEAAKKHKEAHNKSIYLSSKFNKDNVFVNIADIADAINDIDEVENFFEQLKNNKNQETK